MSFSLTRSIFLLNVCFQETGKYLDISQALGNHYNYDWLLINSTGSKMLITKRRSLAQVVAPAS